MLISQKPFIVSHASITTPPVAKAAAPAPSKGAPQPEGLPVLPGSARPSVTTPPVVQVSGDARLAGLAGSIANRVSTEILTGEIISTQQDVRQQVASLNDLRVDIAAKNAEISSLQDRLAQVQSPDSGVAGAALAALLGVPFNPTVFVDPAIRASVVAQLQSAIGSAQHDVQGMQTQENAQMATLTQTAQQLQALQRQLAPGADPSGRLHDPGATFDPNAAPTADESATISDLASKQTEYNVKRATLAVFQNILAHLPSPPSLAERAAADFFSGGAAEAAFQTMDAARAFCNSSIAALSDDCGQLQSDIAADQARLAQEEQAGDDAQSGNYNPGSPTPAGPGQLISQLILQIASNAADAVPRPHH